MLLAMPELMLHDVPPRLMNELREWAALRRTNIEQAAIEMIRIGLYETRARGGELPAGLDVADLTKH